jgi:hypothetical protein
MIPTGADIQRSFNFTGSVAVEHRIGSVPLLFFADVDHDEVLRRNEAGVGAIVDRRVINALWEVPHDLAFPRDALPDWVVHRLALADVVEIGDVVRRHVRPPLIIRGAAVVGRSLPLLLDALGPLSSVCATAAVLTNGSPSPSDPALLDAQLFGVAVGVAAAGGIRVLNEAQTVRPDVGAYQWHVAELVYSEIAEVS